MNFQELEAMVLHHAQQIKDIAAHLLELQQYMEFKRREWVGLTDEDINDIVGCNDSDSNGAYTHLVQKLANRCKDMFQQIEDKLREKNT